MEEAEIDWRMMPLGRLDKSQLVDGYFRGTYFTQKTKQNKKTKIKNKTNEKPKKST
jgi:hypothetical protein